jgi:hypothetical protein
MSIADQIEQCKQEMAALKAEIDARRGDPEGEQPRKKTNNKQILQQQQQQQQQILLLHIITTKRRR